MTEASTGQPEQGKIQVKLGEPFNIPTEKFLPGEYRHRNIFREGLVADFETENGHTGKVRFIDYVSHDRYSRLIAPAGQVEIRQTTTVDTDGKIHQDFSYPVEPVISIDINTEVLKLRHGFQHPGLQVGRLGDYDREDADRQWHLLPEHIRCTMSFDGKSYKMNISRAGGQTSYDETRKSTMIIGEFWKNVEWRDYFDPDSINKWTTPLFPRDPNILSQISFVLDIKPKV